jgi:hypothetical protein
VCEEVNGAGCRLRNDIGDSALGSGRGPWRRKGAQWPQSMGALPH